jgi:hypothetical protein
MRKLHSSQALLITAALAFWGLLNQKYMILEDQKICKNYKIKLCIKYLKSKLSKFTFKNTPKSFRTLMGQDQANIYMKIIIAVLVASMP